MATRKPRRPAPAGRKKSGPARPKARPARARARTAARRPPARPRPARKAAGRKKAGPVRRSPETLRLRAYSPSLTVNDLRASVAFYTDALGFIVSERWTDDAGTLRGVMLKAGLCELGLSQDDWARGRDRRKGEGVRLWCETGQDIDVLAARIKAAGHALTEAPVDNSWGRSVSFDDPDGYHFTVNRPND